MENLSSADIDGPSYDILEETLHGFIPRFNGRDSHRRKRPPHLRDSASASDEGGVGPRGLRQHTSQKHPAQT
jgi:hypothetical protein